MNYIIPRVWSGADERSCGLGRPMVQAHIQKHLFCRLNVVPSSHVPMLICRASDIDAQCTRRGKRGFLLLYVYSDR